VIAFVGKVSYSIPARMDRQRSLTTMLFSFFGLSAVAYEFSFPARADVSVFPSRIVELLRGRAILEKPPSRSVRAEPT
jgi:hypothetical protein